VVVFVNSLNTQSANEDVAAAMQTMTKAIWEKAESMWQVHPTYRLYSPGGSIGLTAWLQVAIARFG